jgi:hypothetical protein
MPLAGPVSYLPVADQFLEHWSALESSLGDAAALNLGHGIDRAAVREVRARLAQATEAVTRSRIAREEERRHLAELDAMISRRLAQFNRQLAEPGHEAGTPDEAARIWAALEQKGGERFLDGEFSRLDFTTDLSARKLVAGALTASEKALSSARGGRDGAQDQLHAFLELYRERVLELFPSGHESRETLPALDLRRGTHPLAVEVSGRWQETVAIISWEASEEPELDHYEVRAMAGDQYESEDETALARISPEDPLHFSTLFALDEPGAKAVFRVYVVLRSGHERGSQPVVVVRG